MVYWFGLIYLHLSHLYYYHLPLFYFILLSPSLFILSISVFHMFWLGASGFGVECFLVVWVVSHAREVATAGGEMQEDLLVYGPAPHTLFGAGLDYLFLVYDSFILYLIISGRSGSLGLKGWGR